VFRLRRSLALGLTSVVVLMASACASSSLPTPSTPTATRTLSPTHAAISRVWDWARQTQTPVHYALYDARFKTVVVCVSPRAYTASVRAGIAQAYGDAGVPLKVVDVTPSDSALVAASNRLGDMWQRLNEQGLSITETAIPGTNDYLLVGVAANADRTRAVLARLFPGVPIVVQVGAAASAL
jgi:hypothetical protein